MKIELGVSCPACGQLNTVEMERHDDIGSFITTVFEEYLDRQIKDKEQI